MTYFVAQPSIVGASLATHVLSITNMQGDRFAITPEYATWSIDIAGNGGSASGSGAAIGVKQELSPHFGYTVFASSTSSKQFNSRRSFIRPDNTFQSGTYKIEYSKTYGIAFTFDPIAPEKKFRLPLLIGIGVGSAKLMGTEIFPTDTLNIITESKSGVLYVGGFKLNFTIGPFNLIPSVISVYTKPSTIDVDGSTGTNFVIPLDSYLTNTVGLSISYRPLNIDYTYTRDEEDLAVQSLTYTFYF